MAIKQTQDSGHPRDRSPFLPAARSARGRFLLLHRWFAAALAAARPAAALAGGRGLAALVLFALLLPALSPAPVLAQTDVPSNWALAPSGLGAGDEFRLLFVTSTTRDATSASIGDYNTFVQGRAAAGHADIRTYSSGFTAVGSTEAVDARDNTSTTYTTAEKGVPIYWLGGNKVADDYEDFYDGNWDDETNRKNESGNANTTSAVWTGSEHDGTEAMTGDISEALGVTGTIITGRPASSVSTHGPIGSNNRQPQSDLHPLYGLSQVFRVAAANTPATGVPTISGTATVGQTLTASTSGISDDDGLTIPTYTYQWVRVDDDGTSNSTDTGTDSSTYTLVAADEGKKIKVTVTFQDDDQNDETLTSAAFPSAATIRPADRTEPMLQTRMVNLAALQLTYDEALDETSTPAASAFDVMVASVMRALAANDPVAVSGRTVTLTLAAAVSQGETVTVSYAIPATNPIRDESENNAAAHTNLSVTNNTSGLTVNDANATEGSAVSFSVILGPASATAVTVDWTASVATGNTAEASDLGTPLTGSLTFTAGQTLKFFTVNTAQDTIDEDNETFTVTLSNPVGASITDGTAVGTVNDNDNAPVVSVAAASGEEGEDIEFTVTLAAASEKSAEVHWSTSIASNDTAVQGDFTADSGTSTFSPGDTSKTFSVSTEEDTTDEVDETFTVTLSGHSNAGLSRTGTTAKGTIEDDDDAPTLSIAHTSATEGTAASFTVTLSEASGLQVTATWTASIESGNTAILSDLGTPRSGTVTIAAGRRTATLTVNTRHDTTDEPDETFMVTLSNASNAVLSDTAATATGTIQDDDPEPTLSVNDRSAAEGEAAQFTATLSAASAKRVMVSWTASAESDDTAVASDLGGTLSGTATIAAGGRTATFNVRSSEDTTDEPDETYTVTLSDPVNATLSDATGQGTITDDDNPPTVSIRKRDDVEEGDDEVAVIELSAASGKTVTVVWKTSIESGDTAEPGDFTAVPDTTITFVPGETSKVTGFVQTTQDTTDEEPETFTVKIVSATNATVEGRTSQMTIVDDDEPPSVSIADASANEGDTASFAVTLSEPSEKTVTVDWAAVHDGTVADDFTGTTSGQLVYTPGQDSKTVAIRTKEDNIDEIDERFSVDLTLPANANATPEDVRADGRIRDDDETEVSVSGAGDVTEGEDAVFTLTLSNPNSRNITVYFVTEALTTGTTATPDVDFVALGAVGDFALMVIPAGETTDTIAVSTIDDDLDEPREPFRLSLAPPDADGVDLTLNRLQVRARINDNDDAPAVELVLTPATIGEDGGSTRITARLPATSSRSSRQTTVTVLASHAAPTEATDYDLSVDRVLTIPAEQRESTGTVTISANDNVVDAPDKTLTVSATVQNSLGATAPAARTLPIVNDEDEPRVTLALSDATIDETGGTTVLTATLSHPSSEDTTVTVTAQASSFTMSPATGRVTIAAGQTSGTGSVTLTAVDNATDAPDNAVTVTASANNGFRVAQPAGIALTIADDDLPPTVTLHLSGASTGEAGGSATVQARLSHPSSADTTVTVSREDTVPRAAESALTGARLAITAGSTASLGMATITPTDNETDAPDQVVQIGASVENSQGHAGAPAPIELTITDDEAPPTVTLHLSEVSISEEEGVTSVTATLSHPSSEATTVTVLTAPVPPAVSGDVTQSGDALSIAALATDSTGAVTVTAVPNFVDTLDKRVTVGGTAENG